MQTERRKERIVEIAAMVVEELRPVAQKLGMLPSTPQPELEPPTPNQLFSASSGVASSSTAQGVGMAPEPFSIEVSAPPTGSATGSSPTSPNESSYPSRSLTSSSEHAGRDPTVLV